MTARRYAITVFGHDRPGIISEVMAVLADLGVNVEDARMTLLGGHFSMMLLCPADGSHGRVAPSKIEHALSPLTAEDDLDLAVRLVTEEPSSTPGGSEWILTIHGGDRPGVVSAVLRELAAAGGNITDLTTRLSGDRSLLVAELALPDDADVPAVEAAIGAAAEEVGVTATLGAAEADRS